MAKSPVRISRALIEEVEKNGYNITNLKLQKLLYFAYGLYYMRHKKPLFWGNLAQWAYGPVSEESYHFFKKYGAEEIPSKGSFLKTFNSPLTEEEKKVIKTVIEKLGDWSAAELVAETHVKGGPWDEAKRNGEDYLNDESILKFFENNYKKKKK